MSVAIKVDHVCKKYGDNIIIPDLTANIKNGEFFTLLGPSGCGKTTLLRMIAGFNSIEAGTISFGDQVINELPTHQRNIGMVFQSYAIFPHLTVAENVAYGLKAKKCPKEQIPGKVEEALDLVQIKNLKDRKPNELSGGQLQRVCIARAVACKPEIILFDEAISSLDAHTQVQVMDLLRELKDRLGLTYIFITHDLGVVAQTCKRVAVMCGGYVVEEGTVEEIFLNPGHPYTQALIASMPRVGGTFEQFLERDLSDGSGNLCPFLNRCKYADKTCEACLPKYYESSEEHKILCHRREEEK